MKGFSLVGVHSAGGIVMGPGISKFTIDGSVVAAVGDLIAYHGEGPHAAATIVVGHSKMTVGNQRPARAGEAVSCGCMLTGLSTDGIE